MQMLNSSSEISFSENWKKGMFIKLIVKFKKKKN